MKSLIFGASGALGKRIFAEFRDNGWVPKAYQRESTAINSNNTEKYDAIIFSQGMNTNDSIFSHNNFEKVLEANLGFIVKRIVDLLDERLLQPDARITILSSIWKDLSRTEKFSYTISKSALRGLVNSLVADLSPKGVSINAICPGVVRTPMTSANLNENQIKRLEQATPLQKLVTPDQVAKATFWISSPLASGINGQFITIDNGWKNVREI